MSHDSLWRGSENSLRGGAVTKGPGPTGTSRLFTGHSGGDTYPRTAGPGASFTGIRPEPLLVTSVELFGILARVPDSVLCRDAEVVEKAAHAMLGVVADGPDVVDSPAGGFPWS